MKVYTLKNVLKYFQIYGKPTTYILKATGNKTSYEYMFTVANNSISLTISNGLTENYKEINDIEMLSLPDKDFTILNLADKKYRTKDVIFEESSANVFYEAQVFVKLFRAMNERVSFTFLYDDKFYDCYYLDGKVYYIEETSTDYNVRGTDLFKLAQTHTGYKIVSVSPPRIRLSYADFMDKHHRLATLKEKKFNKYKFDTKL